MPQISSEVVVIGGGVIGCAITYYLAKEGLQVCLLEKHDIACEASGANTGSINMQSRAPGLERQLGWTSALMFPELEDELGYDIEYVRNGTLIFFDSYPDMLIAKARVANQKEAGLEIELLDGGEARRWCPILSKDILGATFSPMDAAVNPIKSTLAFSLASKRLGAQIMLDTEVIGIEMDGYKICSVITKKDRINTELVINAAGMCSIEIGRMVGLNLPIFPLYVQLMVTEPTAPIAPVARGLLMHTTEMKVPTGYLRGGIIQTKDGGIIIGGFSRILEQNRLDKAVAYEGFVEMGRLINRLAPELRNLTIIRSWASITASTPDEFPIIGRVEGLEGFIIASGHTGEGCAQAPITGNLVADLVMGRDSVISLDMLNLSRF